VLEALAGAGADAIEVGIPFSDPMIDGSVIQESSLRALQRGTTPDGVLADLSRSTSASPGGDDVLQPHLPGRPRAHRRIDAAVGVRGAIIPDLPLEEVGGWAGAADAHDVATVLLWPRRLPTSGSPPSAGGRAASSTPWAAWGDGRAVRPRRLGAPGGGAHQGPPDLPVCVGIGVSTPEQAAAVCEVADGVVVGSALVRRLLEGAGPEGAAEFVARSGPPSTRADVPGTVPGREGASGYRWGTTNDGRRGSLTRLTTPSTTGVTGAPAPAAPAAAPPAAWCRTSRATLPMSRGSARPSCGSSRRVPARGVVVAFAVGGVRHWIALHTGSSTVARTSTTTSGRGSVRTSVRRPSSARWRSACTPVSARSIATPRVVGGSAGTPSTARPTSSAGTTIRTCRRRGHPRAHPGAAPPLQGAQAAKGRRGPMPRATPCSGPHGPHRSDRPWQDDLTVVGALGGRGPDDRPAVAGRRSSTRTPE